MATRLQEFKDSGADASRVEVAEAKAAVVTNLVNEYEGAFVAVGRTLAEIINLPAKVFTKAIWLHNMMEVTEGPVTQPMREAYDRINVESEEAENRYRTNIDEALDEFEEAITG